MAKNNNNVWIIAGVAVIAGIYFKWDSIKNFIQGSIGGTTEIKTSSPLWIEQSAEAKKFVQPGEEAILAKIVEYDSDLAIQQTILEKSVADNMPLKQEIYEYAKGTLAKIGTTPIFDITPTLPDVNIISEKPKDNTESNSKNPNEAPNLADIFKIACDIVISDISTVDKTLEMRTSKGFIFTGIFGNEIEEKYTSYLKKIQSFNPNKRLLVIDIVRNMKKDQMDFLLNKSKEKGHTDIKNIILGDAIYLLETKPIYLTDVATVSNNTNQQTSNYATIPAITKEYFPTNKYWGL